MKKISLIALDLDGTLLDSSLQISLENQQSIRNAIAQGVEVIIATGRSYHGIPIEQLASLGIKYVITSNGAAIYKIPEKACIFEDNIPFETILPIVQKLSGFDILLHIFINGQCYSQTSKLSIIDKLSCTDAFRTFLRTVGVQTDDLTEYLVSQRTPVQKGCITFYRDEDDNVKDWEDVYTYLASQSMLKCVDGGVANLEFTNAKVSKAHALKVLADYLSVSMEETMACGDSENDLDIIEAAGIGVAMDNAADMVKASADFISLTNNQHGVAYAINHFLDIH